MFFLGHAKVDKGEEAWWVEVEGEFVLWNDSGVCEVLYVKRTYLNTLLRSQDERMIARQAQDAVDWFANPLLLFNVEEWELTDAR